MTAILAPLPAEWHPEAVERLFRAVRGYWRGDPIRPEDKAVYDNFTDQSALNRVMMCLFPRQITVLVIRYGLVGNQPETLKSAARVLGMSMTQVRHIEAGALAALRSEILHRECSVEDATPLQAFFGSDGAPGERICNILRRGGVRTVEDLVGKTERDLLCIHNFGPVSLRRVMFLLDRLGLSLQLPVS